AFAFALPALTCAFTCACTSYHLRQHQLYLRQSLSAWPSPMPPLHAYIHILPLSSSAPELCRLPTRTATYRYPLSLLCRLLSPLLFSILPASVTFAICARPPLEWRSFVDCRCECRCWAYLLLLFFTEDGMQPGYALSMQS
ncbi:hypothetical protein BKA57DRAFT_525946, partial [Linnemannia elongata]